LSTVSRTETLVEACSSFDVQIDFQADTFKVETQDLPTLQDGQVLLKTIAIGNLPAQRTWMDNEIDPKRLYAPPIKKGEVVRAPGIAEVLESKSDKYKVGQRVVTFVDWREKKVVKAEEIQGEAASIEGKSEWLSLTMLGVNGLTAWAGVFREMKLKPEDTLLVSGAAGSVGTCIVQLAKHVVGCKRVVGIAGGKEKCDWVKSLGADECVDYKAESFAKDLAAALPDEADHFFDNVGGPVLDEAMTLIKRYGHLTICGAISGYHGKPLQLTNWREIVYNRYTIKGYILSDHAKEFPTAAKELREYVSQGKLTVDKETVVDTKFEDVPKTWQRLFSGDNQGTLVTKLV